jgi:hypothetical protein
MMAHTKKFPILKTSGYTRRCYNLHCLIWKTDASTLYTTIPHSKLNDKLRKLVQLCFIKRNGQRRYKYLVLRRDRSYFVEKHSDSNQKVIWNWYHQHARVLINNIFVVFGGITHDGTHKKISNIKNIWLYQKVL